MFSLHDWLGISASRDRYRSSPPCSLCGRFFTCLGFLIFTFKLFRADFCNHLFSRAQYGVCVPRGLAAELFSGRVTIGCRFCRRRELELRNMHAKMHVWPVGLGTADRNRGSASEECHNPQDVMWVHCEVSNAPWRGTGFLIHARYRRVRMLLSGASTCDASSRRNHL